ncbi:MAG: DUF488 family protein [Ectothiorhodospiraceae bacterium]|nr:DUF488 family protein [Ectothiorhodospiraceae bacterium]
MQIRVKRVYESAEAGDGTRVLVDGIWPRGVSRASAGVDAWARDVAPSAELRRWFDHQPARWDAFRARYFAELDAAPQAVSNLLAQVSGGVVTLVYAARETRYNNAVALAEYLQARSR